MYILTWKAYQNMCDKIVTFDVENDISISVKFIVEMVFSIQHIVRAYTTLIWQLTVPRSGQPPSLPIMEQSDATFRVSVILRAAKYVHRVQ